MCTLNSIDINDTVNAEDSRSVQNNANGSFGLRHRNKQPAALGTWQASKQISPEIGPYPSFLALHFLVYKLNMCIIHLLHSDLHSVFRSDLPNSYYNPSDSHLVPPCLCRPSHHLGSGTSPRILKLPSTLAIVNLYTSLLNIPSDSCSILSEESEMNRKHTGTWLHSIRTKLHVILLIKACKKPGTPQLTISHFTFPVRHAALHHLACWLLQGLFHNQPSIT